MEGQCSVCKTPTTMQCNRCKRVKYCSEKCQRLDWARHRAAECSADSAAKPQTAIAPGIDWRDHRRTHDYDDRQSLQSYMWEPPARTMRPQQTGRDQAPSRYRAPYRAISASMPSVASSNYLGSDLDGPGFYNDRLPSATVGASGTTPVHAEKTPSDFGLRLATADEMAIFVKWASRLLHAPVSGIVYGVSSEVAKYMRTLPSDKEQLLPVSAVLAMAYVKDTGVLLADCAIFAILVKSYALSNENFCDYFPALIGVPGNTALAVTTTMMQAPEGMLRTTHTSPISAHWIAPMANSSGVVEWYGYEKTGLYIASRKEAWGAHRVYLHEQLKISIERARELLTMYGDFDRLDGVCTDNISKGEEMARGGKCMIVHMLACAHTWPILAVYQ